MGLADQLTATNVKVFGPSKAASQLEADKWFAKEIMRHQAIPTADVRHIYRSPGGGGICLGSPTAGCHQSRGPGHGQGCHHLQRPAAMRWKRSTASCAKRNLGAAGSRIVIEEMLRGPECSVLALVSKRTIYVLEPAQDHKPVNDGDTGPITGGMGAYSPTPVMSDQLLAQIEKDILIPVIDGLARENIDYNGCLYAGLMLTANGPKVLEFNCRFGDPETQPLMMRLQSDLAEAMLAVAEGHLDRVELKWDPRPAVCVVASSKGYPLSYPKGIPITGVEQADAMEGVKVFHSGTKLSGKTLVTDGGRVLGVTALGADYADARSPRLRRDEQDQF